MKKPCEIQSMHQDRRRHFIHIITILLIALILSFTIVLIKAYFDGEFHSVHSLQMLILFIPMLIAFFFSHNMSDLPKSQKWICRLCMMISCAVLYLGAMWVMPSDGKTMSSENIWHGILSFGGMLMIFMTYFLYAVFIYNKDKEGARLLLCFLAFTMITGAFAVLNVFDEKSYVIASAVSELYVLTMMSLIGYLTYYLAYQRAKS